MKIDPNQYPSLNHNPKENPDTIKAVDLDPNISPQNQNIDYTFSIKSMPISSDYWDFSTNERERKETQEFPIHLEFATNSN